MINKKTWLFAIILPLIGVVLIDQVTKFLATGLRGSTSIGPIRFELLLNEGFMLGSMTHVSKLYTLVLPTTLGSILLFVFFVFQYFIPIASVPLRLGMSLFTGGVIGNIIDKICRGYVIDFIAVESDLINSAVFNLADAIQWLGVGLIILGILSNGHILYPINQRRGRLWIEPSYQMKYCAILAFAGISFSAIAGTFSYTFLKFMSLELGVLGTTRGSEFLKTFLSVYFLLTASFLMGLFVLGVKLSHRSIGPIKSFESYLLKLLNGEGGQFKLRATDDFKNLEDLADKYYKYFHEGTSLAPDPLLPGQSTPSFISETLEKSVLDISELLSKSKVWIIFYRYSTCPLCAVNLSDIKDLIIECKELGVQTLLIYENSRDQFPSDPDNPYTNLILSLNVPVIFDKDRVVYRKFRSRQDSFGVAHFMFLKVFFTALMKGYFQTKITGNFGRLPGHFLINKRGTIHTAFYGKHFTDHIDPIVVRNFARQVD
ncbi:MAG: signal peptidase II [Proteobacteria bacterium]|nr:signal peptidase II [Pseudomonadota bacterium]